MFERDFSTTEFERFSTSTASGLLQLCDNEWISVLEESLVNIITALYPSRGKLRVYKLLPSAWFEPVSTQSQHHGATIPPCQFSFSYQIIVRVVWVLHSTQISVLKSVVDRSMRCELEQNWNVVTTQTRLVMLGTECTNWLQRTLTWFCDRLRE